MSNVDDFFPVGAVVALGGTVTAQPDDSYWLLCDGSSKLVGDFQELYAAIGRIYGGDAGNGTFKVPDYQGKFLRGTSYDSKRDPDASQRTSLAVPPGESNTVGTTQPSATRVPNNPFVISALHLPVASFNISGETKPDAAAGPNGNNTMETWSVGSGDGDTRPVNVYVNFYIKAKST